MTDIHAAVAAIAAEAETDPTAANRARAAVRVIALGAQTMGRPGLDEADAAWVTDHATEHLLTFSYALRQLTPTTGTEQYALQDAAQAVILEYFNQHYPGLTDHLPLNLLQVISDLFLLGVSVGKLSP